MQQVCPRSRSSGTLTETRNNERALCSVGCRHRAAKCIRSAVSCQVRHRSVLQGISTRVPFFLTELFALRHIDRVSRQLRISPLHVASAKQTAAPGHARSEKRGPPCLVRLAPISFHLQFCRSCCALRRQWPSWLGDECAWFAGEMPAA
jgi:hypothetical protein